MNTDDDRCRCGQVHSIDCITVARTQPHAMVDPDGGIYYPDNLEDARAFAQEEEAVPLCPADFPFDLDDPKAPPVHLEDLLSPEQTAKMLSDLDEIARTRRDAEAGHGGEVMP